jgi:hypothetical protein
MEQQRRHKVVQQEEELEEIQHGPFPVEQLQVVFPQLEGKRKRSPKLVS